MATVFDVALYILQKRGPMTAIKLQKLVYYCQAWALVWDEKPLFSDEIEAWANGPVVRKLWRAHQGMYDIAASALETCGQTDNLSQDEKETVEAVLKTYGDKTSHWLVELTHLEEPWRTARGKAGALPGQVCDEVITHADMAEYYSGLIV